MNYRDPSAIPFKFINQKGKGPETPEEALNPERAQTPKERIAQPPKNTACEM